MGVQLVLRGTRGPRTSCPRGTCGPRTSCLGGQLVLGPCVQGDNLRGGHPILGHWHNFLKKPGHDIFQAGPKLSVAFFGIKSPEASCLLKDDIQNFPWVGIPPDHSDYGSTNLARNVFSC